MKIFDSQGDSCWVSRTSILGCDEIFVCIVWVKLFFSAKCNQCFLFNFFFPLFFFLLFLISIFFVLTELKKIPNQKENLVLFNLNLSLLKVLIILW